jgi:hypothetical protein
MVRPVWRGPGSPDWEDHIGDCPLRVFHCHVGGQLYYSQEEYETVYPDGQLPQVGEVQTAPVGTALDKVKDWISVGFTSGGPVFGGPSDHTSGGRAIDFNAGLNQHKNHVHVSLPASPVTVLPVPNPEIRPGDIVTIKNGSAVKAESGDTVAGIVIETKMMNSGGGSVTLATDIEAWKRAHTIDPAELLGNTQTAQ